MDIAKTFGTFKGLVVLYASVKTRVIFNEGIVAIKIRQASVNAFFPVGSVKFSKLDNQFVSNDNTNFVFYQIKNYY